jgi:hypothetical protein
MGFFIAAMVAGLGLTPARAVMLFAEAVSHFLAPARNSAQQRQATVEVGNDRYPAAALAVAATAPTARDTPLAEQVTVQHRAIETGAPGEQQLDRLMGQHAVIRLCRRDDGIPGRCAWSRHGRGPAPGASWPARLHITGVRCIASRADAWAWHRRRRTAPGPGQWKRTGEKRRNQ